MPLFLKNLMKESLKWIYLSYLILNLSWTNVEAQGSCASTDGPNKEIADSISYKNAPKNQSYNKIYPVRNEVSNGAPSDWPTSNASRNDVGWQWSKNLTPGMKNNITINNTTAVLSKSIKVGNNDNVNMATVAIGDTIKITKQSFNPWFLFFIAIAITIISAIIILLLKLKIFKKNVRS